MFFFQKNCFIRFHVSDGVFVASKIKRRIMFTSICNSCQLCQNNNNNNDDPWQYPVPSF